MQVSNSLSSCTKIHGWANLFEASANSKEIRIYKQQTFMLFSGVPRPETSLEERLAAI